MRVCGDLVVACWTANREVWGSSPVHGRNLVWDFCSTCALYPAQLWWVHWLYYYYYYSSFI